MNRVTQLNYEAFLLDYAEGNLSAELTADLLLFLEQHPELKVDLEGFSDAQIEPEYEVRADFKNELHKNASQLQHRFEELCIVFYEKSISGAEKQELDSILQQFPAWRTDFIAFGKVFLLPDLSVMLDEKSALIKEVIPAGGFEAMAVQELEGLLSVDESRKFHERLRQNPELEKEWVAFMHARLSAHRVSYPNKYALYRTSPAARLMPMWVRIAVAASILLLAGLFFIMRDQNRSETQRASISPGDSVRSYKPAKIDTAFKKKKAPLKFQRIPEKKTIPVMPSTPKRSKPLYIPPANGELVRQELASLQPTRARIASEFQLEATYLSGSPESRYLVEQPPIALIAPQTQTVGQFIGNAFRKAWKRSRVKEKLPEMNKDSLAESGIKGLERITNGAVSITRRETSEGIKITGFSIGPLAFRRSAGSN